MKKSRGIAVVLVLMIFLILMVLGLGFLTAQSMRYRTASEMEDSVKVRALAEAGIEDARGKLERDLRFPPIGAPEQKSFGYSVDLHEITTGNRIGSYTVRVDLELADKPYSVIRIRSVGHLGARELPRAQASMESLIDISPDLRGAPGTPNPSFFDIIQHIDKGTL